MKTQRFTLRLFILVLPLLIAATSGCQKALLYSKGVRNPSIQTKGEVNRFLEKRGVKEYDGSFIVKDSVAFIKLIGIVKSFPSVSFFTSTGNLIVIRDTGYCAGVAFNFASDLNRETPLQIDSTFHLRDLNPLLSPLNDPAEITPGGVDVIAVGFWATYLGAINNNVFGVVDALYNNPDTKSKIYLVNTDFMDFWGMKKRLGNIY